MSNNTSMKIQGVTVDLLDKLNREIENPQGVCPINLIEKVIENKDEVSQGLLGWVDDFFTGSFRDISLVTWKRGIIACILLGRMRDIRLFPYLIKLSMLPSDCVDTILDDFSTEHMPIIIAQTITNQFDIIDEIALNQHLDKNSRGNVIEVYRILYRYNIIDRDFIIGKYKLFFDHFYDDFSIVPSYLVAACGDIRAVELQDKINYYFERDVIKKDYINEDSITESFSCSEEVMLTRLKADPVYSFTRSLEKEFGWLFKKGEEVVPCQVVDYEEIVNNLIDKIQMNKLLDEEPIKRKAPCPCGSGFKYKRCCWRPEKGTRGDLSL